MNKVSKQVLQFIQKRGKLLVFALVACLHLVIVFTLNFAYQASINTAEENASVVKLVDLSIKEPEKIIPPPVTDVPVQEAISEKIIETETEVPLTTSDVPMPQEDYVPMHKISQVPEISETLLRQNLRYPEMARRSEKEGIVYLELFIDQTGIVRKISVLKEEPSGLGFAEAAVRAFTNFVCKPAMANGKAVAVRYRYPIRFSLL